MIVYKQENRMSRILKKNACILFYFNFIFLLSLKIKKTHLFVLEQFCELVLFAIFFFLRKTHHFYMNIVVCIIIIIIIIIAIKTD